MVFLIKGQHSKPEATEIVTWGGDYGKVKDILEEEVNKSDQTYVKEKGEDGSITYQTVENESFFRLSYTPSITETV